MRPVPEWKAVSEGQADRKWQRARVIIPVALSLVVAAIIIWQGGGRDPQLRRPLPPNKRAPEFRVEATDGRMIALSDYRGDKTVVLYFWAGMCQPCRTEVRDLNNFYKKYHTASSDFEVLAISNDVDPADAARVASTEQLAFPALLDSSELVARAYSRDELPMMVIIDKHGDITYARTGHDPTLNLASKLKLMPAAAISQGER